MTYRGIVQNGVVIIDGDKPDEGTVVEITPVAKEGESVAELPAFGIWRDRKDLAADGAEASNQLREQTMRRGND